MKDTRCITEVSVSPRMVSSMQLNLGCGMHKPSGWYNVDIWPGCEPDMVADAVTLGLPAGSVERVYLGHILEHLAYDSIYDCLYNTWRMLEPGGWVCAVAPDLDKVNKLADPLLWETLQKNSIEGRTDQHAIQRWECTELGLVRHMQAHFPNAQPVDLGRLPGAFPLVSTVHWQCAVMARKPSW